MDKMIYYYYYYFVEKTTKYYIMLLIWRAFTITKGTTKRMCDA